MSYHVYNTKGIVIKRKVSGESDTVLYILTEDFGLIIASARATRNSGSKLKGSLQEYSLCEVSLVKGKNGWKITNAILINNFYFDLNKESKKILAKICLLLTKIIVGEIPHREVFDIVRSGFLSLSQSNEEDYRFIESLVVLRVLRELGYVVFNEESSIYLSDNNDWSSALLMHVKENSFEVVKLINKALKESQL